MKQPVVDVDSILADNKASFRDDEVRAIVEDARKEREHGRIVMIGGDFNEPSHLIGKPIRKIFVNIEEWL